MQAFLRTLSCKFYVLRPLMSIRMYAQDLESQGYDCGKIPEEETDVIKSILNDSDVSAWLFAASSMLGLGYLNPQNLSAACPLPYVLQLRRALRASASARSLSCITAGSGGFCLS